MASNKMHLEHRFHGNATAGTHLAPRGEKSKQKKRSKKEEEKEDDTFGGETPQAAWKANGHAPTPPCGPAPFFFERRPRFQTSSESGFRCDPQSRSIRWQRNRLLATLDRHSPKIAAPRGVDRNLFHQLRVVIQVLMDLLRHNFFF